MGLVATLAVLLAALVSFCSAAAGNCTNSTGGSSGCPEQAFVWEPLVVAGTTVVLLIVISMFAGAQRRKAERSGYSVIN